MLNISTPLCTSLFLQLISSFTQEKILPKNLGIGIKAVLAWWQQPKMSMCYVSSFNSPAQSLLHQHAGHLAAMAMPTSTWLVVIQKYPRAFATHWCGSAESLICDTPFLFIFYAFCDFDSFLKFLLNFFYFFRYLQNHEAQIFNYMPLKCLKHSKYKKDDIILATNT